MFRPGDPAMVLPRTTSYFPDATEGTARSNKPIAEKVFAGVKACGPAGSVSVCRPAKTSRMSGMDGGGIMIGEKAAEMIAAEHGVRLAEFVGDRQIAMRVVALPPA